MMNDSRRLLVVGGGGMMMMTLVVLMAWRGRKAEDINQRLPNEPASCGGDVRN